MRNEKHKIIWAIAAVVIGVAVPYFLVDASTKVYHKVAVYFGYEKQDVNTVFAKKDFNSLPSLGSNDTDQSGDGEVMLNTSSTSEYYFESPDYVVPRTSALAYVVGDVDTGEIIVEKNADQVFPIASVSKLVTSLVAKQNMDQHAKVTVTRSSIDMYGTSGGLKSGEKILVTDLYYPLLMESSNDAAEVFAEGYDEGYDEFIKLMNKEAQSIGMTSTSFFEPSGLSEKNVSSASDLFKLAGHITKNFPDIWDITRVRQYGILGHSWVNASILSRKPEYVGGKNGFTYEANETTVVVLNIPMEGGPRRIAITILKSNTREADVNALERFVAKWVGYLPTGKDL